MSDRPTPQTRPPEPGSAETRATEPRTDPPPAPEACHLPGAGAPSPGEPFPRRRRLSRGCLVGLVLLALLAVDQLQPPRQQVSAHFLLAGIDLYQATLSRAMPTMGVSCRFRPTCSHYAEGAIERHGAVVGTVFAVGRILRCGPWTPEGTVDPP